MEAKNRLKDPKIKSADLCRKGMNPESRIKLFKGRAKGGEELKESLADRIIKAFTSSVGHEPSYEFVEQIEQATGEFVSPQSELMAMQKAMSTSLNDISDYDMPADEKSELLQKCVVEFTEAMAKAVESMIDGDEDDYDDDYGDEEEIDDMDDNEENHEEHEALEFRKGGLEDMPIIDFEKMEPEDQAIIEELQKKYAPDDVEKACKPKKALKEDEEAEGEEMNPMVKKALDEVAELKKSLEMQEMTAIAKGYECIGKKAEELSVQLYDLKKSDEKAFSDYVAIMDELKKSQEQSGIFKEFGSSNGTGVQGQDAAWNQLEEVAKGYMANDVNVTYATAINKAMDNNPELVAKYEGRI